MQQQGLISIKYEVNGMVYESDGNNNNDYVRTHTMFSDTPYGKRLHIQLIPKTPITILYVNYTFKHEVGKQSRLFFNGYQSWTDSQEISVADKMPSLSQWVKPIINKYQFDKYGDTMIRSFNNRKGEFHGFTYSYVKNDDQLQLIGSIDEASGFTIIEYSHHKKEWIISKDNQRLLLDKQAIMLDIVFLEGTENVVFDEYFSKMNVTPRTTELTSGWTSWYNHYQNISESIILHNLTSFAQLKNKVDVFQIDDGYQQAIGDWLNVNQDKFPSGMKHIADQIHTHNLKAGIWLAPFVCETDSELFKNHPDWIRKNNEGQFLMGGSNWSGFYALDLEIVEVKEYIKHCFDVVLNEWGYDMVKLDFLYAACLLPTQTKTRGQLMSEAMDFLRECVGDKLILGCGVPLASAFGKVDYCRIGCDVGLDWNDKFFMRWFHRERISTYHSINNAIGRSHLNKRAFINDPDVFILRDESVALNQVQKRTLATINKLFGSLLFTSDDISEYNSTKMSLFEWVTNKDEVTIVSKTCLQKGVYHVVVMLKDKKMKYMINTTNKSIAYDQQGKKIAAFEVISMEEL